MVALAAYFGLDSGQTGLLTTVTLVVSAVGGAVAGVLADRIGRVRALMITVITYAVFTVACGFAPNYETLLVFRALQGLGFGGEWAVGAILVAEYASAKHRGRTLARGPERLGRGLGAGRDRLHAGLLSFVDDDLAWRVMFWTGALPALLVLWVRRRGARTRPRRAAVREESTERARSRAIFRGRRPAAHDALRGAARHRRPGRLLHARHLGADLPEDRARPVGRRHRRLPDVPHLRRLHRLL